MQVQKFIQRLLQAKRVRFKGRHTKKIVAYPRIDDLLLEIMSVAPNWSQRHVPKYTTPGSIDPGTHCAYLSKVMKRTHGDKRGVYFEICTYDQQRIHDVATLDHAAAVPPLIQTTLPPDGSNDRAITSTIRGVALGEIVIIESSKGTGGQQVVEKVLGTLIQRFCIRPLPPPGTKPDKNPNWPSIELMDVVSDDLKMAIERGGGVVKIALRLASGDEVEQDSFTYRLRDSLAEFENASKFHGTWESDDEPLDTDSVIAVASETLDSGHGIDLVSIHLADKSKINSIGKYKMRSEVNVKVDSAGVPYASDIVEGLWDFLDKLRVANANLWRLINDDGYFTSGGSIAIPINP